MHGGPLYFARNLSFFSIAVLRGHRTERDQTLSHVHKWIRFEKKRVQNLEDSLPLKRGTKNCPLSGGVGLRGRRDVKRRPSDRK